MKGLSYIRSKESHPSRKELSNGLSGQTPDEQWHSDASGLVRLAGPLEWMQVRMSASRASKLRLLSRKHPSHDAGQCQK